MQVVRGSEDKEIMSDKLSENSTRLTELKREIMRLSAQIKPLTERLTVLGAERRDLESRIFITVNNIKKDDVELSSGEGKPWFGTYVEFGKWLKINSTKPWAEWNGGIYSTSDVILGRMPYDSPGCVSNLEL